jgi:hypothetical protein
MPNTTGTQRTTSPTLAKGFLSYAHKDVLEIQKFNELFGPRGRIRKDWRLDLWNDSMIVAGDPWDGAIKNAMAESDFGILAISPDFFDSGYIVATEIQALLNDPSCAVIPFMMTDIDFAKVEMYGIEKHQVFGFRPPNWKLPRSYGKTPKNRHDEFVDRLIDNVIVQLNRLPGTKSQAS